MRYISAIFLTSILLSSTPSFAQKGVLLPSCEGNNCTGTNLGLGVAPAKPKTSEPGTNAGAGAAANPALTPSSAGKAPSFSGGTAAKTNISPGGTVSKSALDDQKKTETFMKAAGLAPGGNNPALQDPNIAKFRQAVAEFDNRPPVVMDDPDSASTEKAAGKLPNTIAIGVAPSYLWGTNDVQSINKLLGYNAQQIPTQCQLRLDARVRTDKGSFKSVSYSGQRTAAKFDGTVKDIRFVPRAVCNAPRGPLPRNGGTLRRIGDKLAIQLRNLNCALPNRNFSSMEIQYTGDGTANCKYN